MSEAPPPKSGAKQFLDGLLIGCVWLVAGLGIYGAVRTIHNLKAQLSARSVDVEVETVQLVNQNKHLQTKLDQRQVELERMQEERDKALAQGKSLMAELDKARDAVNEISGHMAELQKNHDVVLQEKVRLLGQVKDFQTAQEQWQAREGQLKQAQEQLQQEVAPVEKVRKNLQEQLEDERKAAERERRGFEADVRELKKQLKEAKDDNARTQAMLEKIRRELHEATVESQKDHALGELSTTAYKKLSEEFRDKLKDTSGKLSISLRRQAKLEEDNAAMHYNLARLFTENQKYDLAASEYLKVLEIRPDDADSHYNLAVLYDNYLNQRQKAIQHYRQYLKIQPSAKDAALIEGIILSLEAQDRVGEH